MTYQDLVHAILVRWPRTTAISVRPVTTHACEECEQVDELLGGKTWMDVARNFPSYCHDAYPLLTSHAQAYYLPSYMISALTENNSQAASVEAYLCSDNFKRDTLSDDQVDLIQEWVNARLEPDYDQKSIQLITAKLRA